ncbi:MAG: copper chaperone PCu(A)C [Rhodocyclaceae bacterium]|jgi:copper(I)-binding protein|nr:copper chaperone PCu(A)C [Rhodocyclaceae bacterium]
MIAPRHLAALLPLVFALPAAAGEADAIQVESPHVRLMPAAATNSAAFMLLRNGASAQARLVAVASPVAERVELHDHLRDGDVMRMRRVDSVPIAANGQALLQPGGLHVMLIGLKRPLKDGEAVPLDLEFADGSHKRVSAPVQPIRP